MSNTVPTTVKPSGGFIAPAPVTAIEPTTPVRIFTYRLYGGGFLTHQCPDWCIGYEVHKGDLDGTLHPVDLCHEGEEISLSFTTNEGERDTILAARITQFPFSTGSDGSELPHMALMPVAGNGETLGYQTPGQVYAEIRRVREYLLKLEQLTNQLAAELADPLPAWMSLRAADIKTMPIPYLLKAFDAEVVECDDDTVPLEGVLDVLGDGSLINLPRILPQVMREQAVRNLLLARLCAAQVQA